MPRPRRPVAIALLAVAAPLVAACSSGGAVADDADIEARVAAADLAVGAEVYGDICAACHGPEGQGGIGAELTGVAERISVTETHQVVTDGRGRMPAWGNRLDADEVDAVVAYVREQF